MTLSELICSGSTFLIVLFNNKSHVRLLWTKQVDVTGSSVRLGLYRRRYEQKQGIAGEVTWLINTAMCKWESDMTAMVVAGDDHRMVLIRNAGRSAAVRQQFVRRTETARSMVSK